MFNPKSLIDAYSLARIQEECVMTTRRVVRPTWSSNQFQTSSHRVHVEIPVGFSKGNGCAGTRVTMQGHPRQISQPPFGAGQAVKGSGNPNQALVPIQKMSQAQMEEEGRDYVIPATQNGVGATYAV
jgi:hypothetical protein